MHDVCDRKCCECKHPDCICDEGTEDVDAYLPSSVRERAHKQELKREYDRARYAKERSRRLAQHREYYHKNKKRLIAYQVEYYRKNKDRINARRRELYRLRHGESDNA